MKRQKQFDQLILLTTTALLLGSCGPQRGKEASGFSASALMETARNLTAQERTIATRICYAYQSKNSSFRTQSYYGGTFNFSIDYRECSGTSSNYNISAVLTTATDNSNGLIFQTDSTKDFLSKVQTSQKGFLSQLCSKIQTNQDISNTAIDGTTTVQVAFNISDMDQYTLQYFTKQNDQMRISISETFKVRTQFNAGSGQILGNDEFYIKQAVCKDDATKFSEFIQRYNSFTR